VVCGITASLLTSAFIKGEGMRFQILKAVNMNMTVFWVVAPCSQKFTDVSEVFAASIIRAMSKPFTRNCFEIWEPVGQGRT
jgi:hypothetical protein